MSETVDREHAHVELGRAGYELSQARARLDAAVLRAAGAGMSQREIAAAVGTNQAAVHRLLRRHRTEPELPAAVHYERREARYHYELHREIARHILRGEFSRPHAESALASVRARVRGTGATAVLDEWAKILTLPAQRLTDAMLVGGEHGDDLRQLSPLTGIVTEQERIAALNRAYER